MKNIVILALTLIIHQFTFANDVKNYDFNALSTGVIHGQDNWVRFGPGWTNPIIVTSGPDGSNCLFSTAGGNSQSYASRINDANFSITSFSGDETSAFFQIDVLHAAWTSEVGIGYDDNSNSQVELNECGIRLNFNNFGDYIRLYVADNSYTQQSAPTWPPNATLWYTIRVVIDFTANAGQGSASVYMKEYGTNSFAAIAGLQNVNMKLNTTLSNHFNPSFWNAIHFHYDSDGNYHDNLLTANQIHTVTTSTVTSITDNSATCGGEITSDLGDDITAKGVVWSTTTNPTLTTNETGHTSDGVGTGSYVSTITGLNLFTTYYVRAYSTSASGTSYGNEIMFTTIPTLGEWGLIVFGSLVSIFGGFLIYRRFV